MSDISQRPDYNLGIGSHHNRSRGRCAQVGTTAAIFLVCVGSQGTRGYVRGQRILAVGSGPMGGSGEKLPDRARPSGPGEYDPTYATAGWWQRMKRWCAIHFRRWGGKYTSQHAEEWEDWTNQ